MRVRNVSEHHRNALLQHRLNHCKCLRGLRIEAQRAETGEGSSVVIGKAAQRRRDVLHPEKRLITGVAARFIRQQVRHRIVLRRAERAVERAVKRDADEIVRAGDRAIRRIERVREVAVERERRRDFARR